MPKLFQKKKENFICKNCGYFVIGNGYTNHCPRCLYSEHVDINPGDRANTCEGLMEPVGIAKKHSEIAVVHKCIKCGKIKSNKTSEHDNIEVIIGLSAQSF